MVLIKYGIDNLNENQANAAADANLLWDMLAAFTPQPNILDRDLTAPPGSPTIGDIYIPLATATGDWVGHEDEFAVFLLTDTGNQWVFVTPLEGMTAWVADEDRQITYDGSTWQEGRPTVTAGITAVGTTQGAATVLTSRVNQVTVVVAATNDGVQLPPATLGLEVIVINADATGGDTLQVYPATGDFIDDAAVNVAQTQAAGVVGHYYAISGADWYSIQQ